MQAYTRDLVPRVLEIARALQARGLYPGLRRLAEELGLHPDNHRQVVKTARAALIATGELQITPRGPGRPPGARDRQSRSRSGYVRPERIPADVQARLAIARSAKLTKLNAILPQAS